jgi:hypothetical protein
MSGLGNQIDGQHYTAMKMQPVELAYRLYGTPCFCKLAKYLTRDKGDKLVNLNKAKHCVQLEIDLKTYAFQYIDNLDLLSVDSGTALINTFTDNKLYREALLRMWIGDYNGALRVMDDIIAEYMSWLP